MSDMVTATIFTCTMALEAGFRLMNNVPVWRYRYMPIFPSVTPYPWARTYHGGKSSHPCFMLGDYIR
jgi:hypothetical protein